jgi:hypothetical protein
MDEKKPEFAPSVYDAEMHIFVSPEVLPYYPGEGILPEIEKAFETLYDDVAPEEFYAAFATLIFHARHLRPFEHATLADLIKNEYKRSTGKPKNLPLHKAVQEYLHLKNLGLFKDVVEQRHVFVGETAKRLRLHSRVVSNVLKKAEDEFRKQMRKSE